MKNFDRGIITSPTEVATYRHTDRARTVEQGKLREEVIRKVDYIGEDLFHREILDKEVDAYKNDLVDPDFRIWTPEKIKENSLRRCKEKCGGYLDRVGKIPGDHSEQRFLNQVARTYLGLPHFVEASCASENLKNKMIKDAFQQTPENHRSLHVLLNTCATWQSDAVASLILFQALGRSPKYNLYKAIQETFNAYSTSESGQEVLSEVNRTYSGIKSVALIAQALVNEGSVVTVAPPEWDVHGGVDLIVQPDGVLSQDDFPKRLQFLQVKNTIDRDLQGLKMSIDLVHPSNLQEYGQDIEGFDKSWAIRGGKRMENFTQQLQTQYPDYSQVDIEPLFCYSNSSKQLLSRDHSVGDADIKYFRPEEEVQS